MYTEGISLGYGMGILSGLRTFACQRRSNCGVMFGCGGDECAAFASLESVYKGVLISLYQQCLMNRQKTKVNKIFGVM